MLPQAEQHGKDKTEKQAEKHRLSRQGYSRQPSQMLQCRRVAAQRVKGALLVPVTAAELLRTTFTTTTITTNLKDLEGV